MLLSPLGKRHDHLFEENWISISLIFLLSLLENGPEVLNKILKCLQCILPPLHGWNIANTALNSIQSINHFFFLCSPLEKRAWSFIFFNSSPLYPRLLWLWTGLGKQHTYIYILPAFSVLYGLNQFRTCIFLFIPPKMLSTARLCLFT